MKKSLYIVYYYTSEGDKDFEVIISEYGDILKAEKAWIRRFKAEYDQKMTTDDVVSVYEITEEEGYKIEVTKITK